ncbi:DNA polymerase delta subunit 4 isoform X1 [Canis lupus dingo]|uniref:DNA polymerase delta 4, accessory subunit n=1 Tax=Canis lupus dingo TaxID=286419 RepID=A0A8C0JMA3_CANLU|nr:DNA polymerase delta subunit 4 isoform X1 [Canis lupus dingo]
MGRKRLITDSYPVVKRGEGPAGHSKGELAPELGLFRVRGAGALDTSEGLARTRADGGAARGSETCPLLPTAGLAVAGRGKGLVRAGEQWGSCEAGGRPEEPRVIAGEEPQPLSVDEAELELLRQFDLAWQYGPCTGITRLQRWHRAEQMGLEPPPEVRQVLQTHPGDPRFQCSLWHLYPL